MALKIIVLRWTPPPPLPYTLPLYLHLFHYIPLSIFSLTMGGLRFLCISGSGFFWVIAGPVKQTQKNPTEINAVLTQ